MIGSDQTNRLVADPLWVIADPLVQVVLNLVKNAMRLAPDGFITVSAHRKTDPADKGVLIKVLGLGMGVPAHMRARLFDKSTVYLSHLNTGVGLHLCHCIVKSMDGRIYLDESYESGVALTGACFALLPLVANPDGSARNNQLVSVVSREPITTYYSTRIVVWQ
jgi:K+-sensing histidine kinase KdpD